MNVKVSHWVLTDTERTIWVETLELGAAELGVAAPARISIISGLTIISQVFFRGTLC